MSVRKMFAGLAATSVVTATLGLAVIAPASADPVGTPDANDIVGVGSDTIEDVMDALADGVNGLPGYNAGLAASDQLLVSFKTVGSPQITLRAGTDPIVRPVGSGAGKGLLYGAKNNTAVTYARSSSAINTAEAAAGLYAFPFAVDSLKIAVSGSVASHAPASLTGDQVLKIYKGEVTNWSEIGGTAGVIKPYIPQSGSGTRSFFDGQLTALNGGTAVVYGSNVDDTMHENTDDVLKSDPDAIAPFSLAKAVTLYPSSVHLATGWSADRAVYNVVRDTSLNDPTIQGIFGEDGFICSTDARALIEASGFKQLATPAQDGACGAPIQAGTSNFKLNNQVSTTTKLAASSPKAKSAKLVATVAGSTAPQGTVDFFEGDDEVASDVPLVSGQATTTLKGVSAGSHDYTAVFVPADGYDASQDDASVVVTTSSKTSESFPAKVAKGEKATGKVTVKGDGAEATGSVKIKDGGKTLDSAKLKNGVAKFKLKLSKGKNALTAVYAGNADVAGSSTSFTIKQK